jgi:DNA-binding NarL/FixJ family response regulator
MNTATDFSVLATATPLSPLQVLIADDHAMVRDGLRRIIEGEPGLRVSGQAVDGASTLARLCDTPCDVLLLDLSMPAPNGPELIRQIRECWPDLPILVLSMHNQVAVARAALQAGASGYIAKDNDPEVLVMALCHVVGGGRYVEPRLAQALMSATPARPLPTLTPREAEVMHRLSKGESNADIARDLYLSEKTVSTHKTNLLGKLKLNSIVELVRFVDEGRRLGMVDPRVHGDEGAVP